jgi:hypothetical protein
MKYTCDKGHIFIHPAIVTDYNAYTKESIAREHIGFPSSTITVHVCPVCAKTSNNANVALTEFVEPEADITSVLSCDLGAVDGFLKQGYIVKELYAKTATLIKREVKKEQPDPDDNQAITESNDVTDPFVLQARAYYAKLHPEVKTE